MKSGSALSPPDSMRNTSGTSVLAIDHAAYQLSSASLDVLSLLVASLDALSTMDNAAYYRVCFSRNHKTSQCTFIPQEKKYAFTCFCDANFKICQHTSCTGTTNQDKKSFVPKTALIVTTRLEKQWCLCPLQAARRNRRKLEIALKI